MQTLPSSFPTAPTRPAHGQPHMELLPSARPPQRRRRGVHGRPRANSPRRPSTRGAPGGPQRPRTPPPPPERAGGRETRRSRSRRRTPRGARAAGSRRLPAEAATALAFPRPAGPGPGNFPRLEPGQGDPQPSRGGRRGGERPQGNTSGVQFGDRGERQRAGAQGDEPSLGMSWGPERNHAGGGRVVSPGEAFRARRTGGLAREVGAGGSSPGRRGDLQVTGTTAS